MSEITLMTFDYDVVYYKGRNIPHLDGMRHLHFETDEDDEPKYLNLQSEVNFAMPKQHP